MDIDRAIKNERIILKALADTGQVAVARELGVSESSISKSKDSVQPMAKILAACGLKVVPNAVRCVKPEYLQSLEAIAQEHFRTRSETPTLEWD